MAWQTLFFLKVVNILVPSNHMKLPVEIMNQIFEYIYTGWPYDEYKKYSRGYLINKYFTQQFFRNSLKDTDIKHIYKNKDKGILQHLDMVNVFNCFYWEDGLQTSLSLPVCFTNCSVLKCLDK